ncbi:MAG: hypothetical protein B7Y26_11695 [Hydrogenophilales bacterium 16-64-46]|nr:MAG: hypothetical protein B7Y26_11695 [Hydrogenophilales bacterium 16-64-46]OZA38249.1 MAG: hypothetical protein B7X87_07055 [Hydrogenophilales bacterium 17-64-34]HQS99152.1 PEP-CTERM sorting domain-containing protein [Thiobacillus sp.]
MKFTKTILAVALAAASSGAMAAADDFAGGNFTMFDPTGAVAGNFNDITGFVDIDAMTFDVASVTPFFGLPWSATDGVLFGAGEHTVNVNGDGSNALSGTGDVTFTVGAGQVGGNINFAWGASTGIDVFLVWDIVDNGDGTYDWVSTDIDNNGILGLGMIDGAFPGFSANFNFTNMTAAPVPEASTYGMMLAGLGLVGFAVRRRKLLA